MFPVTRPLRQICFHNSAPGAHRPAHAGHRRDRLANQPAGPRSRRRSRAGTQARNAREPRRGRATPRPGEVVYRGLVLRGQEPRGKGFAEIGRADLVRLSRSDHDLTVLLENPELHAASPAQGMALLDLIIQRSIFSARSSESGSVPPHAGSTSAKMICSSRSRTWRESSCPIRPHRP